MDQVKLYLWLWSFNIGLNEITILFNENRISKLNRIGLISATRLPKFCGWAPYRNFFLKPTFVLQWNTKLVQKQQNQNVGTAAAPFRRFCSVLVSLSVVFTGSGSRCCSAVSTLGVRALAESAHKDRQLSGYRHQRCQERLQLKCIFSFRTE